MPDVPYSLATTDLGMGMGDALREQVSSETEEQRKKRLLQIQERAQLGPGGSLAVTSLFGSRGGFPGAGY